MAAGKKGVEPIEDAILALLPADGTPVLNRVIQVRLNIRFAKAVDQDAYFSALTRLASSGKVGRERGQGGKTYRIQVAIEAPPTNATNEAERILEAALMAPLDAYLKGPFRNVLGLSKDALCLTKDISKLGPFKGIWARPDFMLVSVAHFALMPGCQVDVHGFELKAEHGGSIAAVHEALAQTRFTHFGHLVWHLPDKSTKQDKLIEIEEHCVEHGVGLIRIRQPADSATWEVLVDPIRKNTGVGNVDEFLAARLDDKEKRKVADFVRGGRS